MYHLLFALKKSILVQSLAFSSSFLKIVKERKSLIMFHNQKSLMSNLNLWFLWRGPFFKNQPYWGYVLHTLKFISFKYTFQRGFDKFVQQCNHHDHPDISITLCIQSPPQSLTPAPGNPWSVFCLCNFLKKYLLFGCARS